MRIAAVAVIGVAVLATARLGFAADAIAWGPVVNEMRLGIAFGAASTDPELRVLLQNTGSTPRDILIGYQTGRGTAVNFRFIATAPDGKQREGFEINSFTVIGGLVLPAVARVDPGATHELRFALKKIICIERTGDLTLGELVKQGNSLRVSLETDAASAKWARPSQVWSGKMASAELRPPVDRYRNPETM